MSHNEKIELRINGMTCASCELLLESSLGEIPGVKTVKVSQVEGKAFVSCSQVPSMQEFRKVIEGDGFYLLSGDVDEDKVLLSDKKNTRRDYLEIGGVMILLLALYLVFRQTKFSGFGIGIVDNMSYGLIFLIGLVAASSSCIAVAGGVLISVAARYNETHGSETKFEKFKPHLIFNFGRIVSYTVLGGVIGGLGSLFSISPKTTGFITLAAAFFMILMGLKILNFFPVLNRFQLRLPKFIGRKILKMDGKEGKAVPFTMGALTFFLPCGFTQALQIYVISRGSFVDGALVMFFFSLGTLPALLSLGAISSFAKGTFGRLFLKFSGVLVLLMGFYSIQNGLALTGNTFRMASVFSSIDKVNDETAYASNLKMENGKQVISMDIDGLSYSPSHFVLKQGVPVIWKINGLNVNGCESIVVVPDYGISKFVKQGENILEFVPENPGELTFSCPMGMVTGTFTVLPNKDFPVGTFVTGDQKSDGSFKKCDSTVTSCNVQKVAMEISAEKGFYPQIINLKKDIPVELTIDDQVDLGGCMGTITIPDLGVAKLLKIGKNIMTFTPTQVGNLEAVCSMGIHQFSFYVTD